MAAIREAVSGLLQGSSTLLAKKEPEDEEVEDILRYSETKLASCDSMATMKACIIIDYS